jgi:hypothetical protein
MEKNKYLKVPTPLETIHQQHMEAPDDPSPVPTQSHNKKSAIPQVVRLIRFLRAMKLETDKAVMLLLSHYFVTKSMKTVD